MKFDVRKQRVVWIAPVSHVMGLLHRHCYGLRYRPPFPLPCQSSDPYPPKGRAAGCSSRTPTDPFFSCQRTDTPGSAVVAQPLALSGPPLSVSHQLLTVAAQTLSGDYRPLSVEQ